MTDEITYDTSGSVSPYIPYEEDLDPRATATPPEHLLPTAGEFQEYLKSKLFDIILDFLTSIYPGVSSGSVERLPLIHPKAKESWEPSDQTGSNIQSDELFNQEFLDREISDDIYEFTTEGASKFRHLLEQPNPIAARTIERSRKIMEKDMLVKLGKEPIEVTLTLKQDEAE